MSFTRTCVVLLGLAGTLVSTPLCGQFPQRANTRWRRLIDTPTSPNQKLRPLMEALKIAETFGQRDQRLLENLIRIAEICEEPACKTATYLDRAMAMRSKVIPRDAPLALCS